MDASMTGSARSATPSAIMKDNDVASRPYLGTDEVWTPPTRPRVAVRNTPVG